MADHEVKTKPGVPVKTPASMDPEEGMLLAAALAATLVEYRHHVGQHPGYGARNRVGANWRTLGRWEQLRGQAFGSAVTSTKSCSG